MKFTKKCVLLPYDKYERLMQKTTTFHEEKKVEDRPLQEEEGPKRDYSNEKHELRLDEDSILQLFSKTLQSKAKALLFALKQNQRVDWNEKGEVLVNGKVIPHSHIADLIKDAVITFKSYEPTGTAEFYSNLGHIPLTLIKNPHRRQLIQQQRGAGSTDKEIVPPPGFPEENKKKRVIHSTLNEPVKKKNKSDKWKELWQTIK